MYHQFTGTVTKNGSSMMIRNYEIGIVQAGSEFIKSSDCSFPLPYQFPPNPYQTSDIDWVSKVKCEHGFAIFRY
jgi:hypothetical protein